MARSVPLLPAPGCDPNPQLPGAAIRESRTVTLPSKDSVTNSVVTNFASGRLWMAAADSNASADHLVGVSPAGAKDTVIPLPPRDLQRVDSVSASAAWLENDNGLEELAMPSGRSVHSWTYQQLVTPAVGGWLSPDLTSTDGSQEVVVGERYPTGGTHGRFAVSSIAVNSGAVRWTTVLPDVMHGFTTPGEGPKWLATDAAGIYLLLDADPLPNQVTLVRLSPDSGHVEQRAVLNLPVQQGGAGSRIMLTSSSVTIQVDIDRGQSWAGRLIRLDRATLHPTATIDVGGMQNWAPDASGTLNVLASDCVDVAWLWRLDPTTLKPTDGAHRLPGNSEVIVDDGSGNSWIMARGTKSLGLYELA